MECKYTVLVVVLVAVRLQVASVASDLTLFTSPQAPRPVDNVGDEQPPPLPQPRKKAPKTPRE